MTEAVPSTAVAGIHHCRPSDTSTNRKSQREGLKRLTSPFQLWLPPRDLITPVPDLHGRRLDLDPDQTSVHLGHEVSVGTMAERDEDAHAGLAQEPDGRRTLADVSLLSR
jgi:hypothetical protein